MQWERAIAVIERRPPGTLLAGGLVGAALPLLLTPLTPLVGDLALGLVAVTSLAAAWWALRLQRQLGALPLEIAPLVGTGIVDGVRVYRFRVRLGRGRMVAMPSATVTFVDEEDERRALPAEVPADELCGPFTIVVRDPTHAIGDGRFEVRVACEAEGRRWETARELPTDVIREGWFAGIALADGRIRFDSDWTRIVNAPELEPRGR